MWKINFPTKWHHDNEFGVRCLDPSAILMRQCNFSKFGAFPTQSFFWTQQNSNLMASRSAPSVESKMSASKFWSHQNLDAETSWQQFREGKQKPRGMFLESAEPMRIYTASARGRCGHFAVKTRKSQQVAAWRSWSPTSMTASRHMRKTQS